MRVKLDLRTVPDRRSIDYDQCLTTQISPRACFQTATRTIRYR